MLRNLEHRDPCVFTLKTGVHGYMHIYAYLYNMTYYCDTVIFIIDAAEDMSTYFSLCCNLYFLK